MKYTHSIKGIYLSNYLVAPPSLFANQGGKLSNISLSFYSICEINLDCDNIIIIVTFFTQVNLNHIDLVSYFIRKRSFDLRGSDSIALGRAVDSIFPLPPE